MSFFTLSLFIIIIFSNFFKAVIFKKCSNETKSIDITYMLTFFLMFTSLCFVPIYYKEIIHDISKNSVYLTIPLLKGIFYYFYLNSSNNLAKLSGSSRAIVPIVAVGIIAFINYQYLNETLSFNQLISAILITLLGILFYFIGHASYTKETQKFFLLFLMLAIILSVFDHWGLSKLHWSTFMLISCVIVFFMNYNTKSKNKIDIKTIFNNKILLFLCIYYIIMEVFLMSVRVTYIPVTMINIASLISSPLVMMYMNVVHKESTMKNQLMFGIIAALIGIIGIL